MITTIHQPQYLPWLGYFDKADCSDVFILLDNVQFKKNDWQNRNKIRTPQGGQWLTVPVIHNFGQKINEVKINNKINWCQTHLKTLRMNYSRTPFFKEYIGLFEKAYGMEWDFLCDLNIYFIKELIDLLGIQTRIVLSSSFQTSDNTMGRLIDLCRAVGADTYLAGEDGGNYMDLEKFKASGVSLVTQDFQHPAYQQCWTKDFVSHLSIVDLLFNYGHKSLIILRGESE